MTDANRDNKSHGRRSNAAGGGGEDYDADNGQGGSWENSDMQVLAN